jgi:hypothetical protein
VSEYQYYEFQALDKPLTKQQQKELRSLSSRAEITATSFVNEYNYGDFRGEPQKLMERYFDAFCYLANWGTLRRRPANTTSRSPCCATCERSPNAKTKRSSSASASSASGSATRTGPPSRSSSTRRRCPGRGREQVNTGGSK